MVENIIKMQVIVLAAGHGKRMLNVDLPKVLVPLNGQPMIAHLLKSINVAKVCEQVVIVVGQKAELVKKALGDNYIYVTQTEQNGTGHADFNDWRQAFSTFGRIERGPNGELADIVESKDATPEQLKSTEVNLAYFCFRADWLWQYLPKLKTNNAQEEYYLTDLIGLARQQGDVITTIDIEPHEALGVNTPENLNALNVSK